MDDRQLLEAVRQRLALGVTPTVSAVTVRNLCSMYTGSPEATGLAAWATERGRISHLVEVLGDCSAAALTLRDLDSYRRARWNAAPATRNREIVRLTAILRWGVDRGHLAAFPLPRVKLEPEHNQRSTHLAEVDVRAIVSALRARGRHAVAALVATAYDGGLRRAEACRLTFEQIDMKDRVISLLARHTKGKRPRAAPLSAWAADLIQQLPRGEFVFASSRGRPFHPRTVLRYYQQAVGEAGIAAAPGERVWLHDLRAGFADKQVELGTKVSHVMELAGWRDYRTMRRYLRKPPRAIAAGAAALLDASRRPPKRARIGTASEISSESKKILAVEMATGAQR